MRFVCDAPTGRVWFQIETEAEAAAESQLMRHSVAKYFVAARDMARKKYVPPSGVASIERDIGLKAHFERVMPRFLTLRADDGAGLVTAMLPAKGASIASVRHILVGPENRDPYIDHEDAIESLAAHVGFPLPRETCYPYK